MLQSQSPHTHRGLSIGWLGAGMERWQAAMRLIGLGWFVGICIFGGVWGGLWLDGKLGTKPWLTIAGLMVGLVVAFYGVYRMIVPNIDKKQDKGKT